ncbi:Type I restriction enzyme R protein [Desulfonema limicola]|uniref:Type I restriction enzyme endonuclease subunit n=1 Tax=Desulfonema limicola TaxID=45656 RepID=A0A975BC16_9BACT|nr:HsdR family type I site-specific deoxyribonuclease [Desulfonema limicola]QTA82606.1 Type I restriction enzyme R protein [Desulfonema limicola]
MNRTDRTPDHIKKDEKNFVEEPFLEQLQELGWEILRLDMWNQTPKQSFRQRFSDVVMFPRLEQALMTINPWLEPDQLGDVVKRITGFSKTGLMENNQQVLNLLLENTGVSENRQTKEKSPAVRYIDFNEKKNNSFIAVSQLRVRIPGTEHSIFPDIILFLNGLPIVVIECKSHKANDPIPQAINQLLRYSQQRGDTGEGNQTLFYYNQFVVATCRQEAKFGTISSHIEKHFYRWTDPFPKTLNNLAGKNTSPNDQQRLIQGMMYHDNLLSLIKNFTLFAQNDEGKTVKIVARYQQFRAVKIAVQRLLDGSNKYERGGIIWHTQGSGKSLTMMFMVREMYSRNTLKNWKVIFITDRTQLEDQLNRTSQKIGFTVKVADSTAKLKKLLAADTSDLVMAMIHKFQENDLREIFPAVNQSSNILVMTDEAHRSQYSLLGANLDRALPNAVHIAYTGTPTDKTEKKYKDYIDKYTMRQAEEDGVTLEIVYEGRTDKAEVADKEGMDKKFADVFSDYCIEERLQILGYGSRIAYLEAEDIIMAKARDMVHHYVSHIFPGGFKAQIVAVSKEGAVRYKKAIDKALETEIKKLETDNPLCIALDPLKKVKAAVVISGDHNDKKHIKQYTDPAVHRQSIESFKMPYEAVSGDNNGSIGILIVHNMLLVGFDAPIEQVIYLDRIIKSHGLLQAIARVNRPGDEKKTKGFVVDYVGVGHHLKEALDSYDEREQKEITDCLNTDEDEINDLIHANKNIWDLLKKYKITDLDDLDTFYDLFYDEDIRFEFMTAFKKMSICMDVVFPKKEGLDYLNDYQRFTEINVMAGRHFRDSRMSMVGIPEKLRIITDQYLKSRGIDQKIAPIAITDPDFEKHVEKRKRKKTKAAETEHAIRHHLDINMDDDPDLYASFAESIDKILQDFKDNWTIIYKKLEELRQKILNAKKEPTYGLHRKKQMPFFRIFKKELFGNRELSEDETALNVDLTQHVFNIISNELRLTGFWNSLPAQNRLKAELQKLFLSARFHNMPNMIKNRKHIISRVMELAKNKNDTILYA